MKNRREKAALEAMMFTWGELLEAKVAANAEQVNRRHCRPAFPAPESMCTASACIWPSEFFVCHLPASERAMSRRRDTATLPLPAVKNPADTFAIERGLMARGIRPVAGVDEAGRGPLAGPVVAACVILPPDCEYRIFRDSKITSEKERELLFRILHENGAIFGLGLASAQEIDRINILQASLLAMKRATLSCAEKNGALPACIAVVLLSLFLIFIQFIVNMVCMANHFVSMTTQIGRASCRERV